MSLPAIAIDALPELAAMPAAHGAILAPAQVTGSTIFDIVVAVIVISH